MIRVGVVSQNKKLLEMLSICYNWNVKIQIHQFKDIDVGLMKQKNIDILVFEAGSLHEFEKIDVMLSEFDIHYICAYESMNEDLMYQLLSRNIQTYLCLSENEWQLYFLILRIINDNSGMIDSEKKIQNLLDRYQLNRNMQGRELIYQALLLRKYKKYLKMKELYDQIARIEKTTTSRVERNLRMVISKSSQELREMTNRECIEFLYEQMIKEV